jgi:PhoH-like ATPase
MAENRYTLDTNVIMRDPYILDSFHDSFIYIPNVVLQELDNHKNDRDLGRGIRIFSRILDGLHENNYITDKNNQVFFIDTDDNLDYLGGKTNDNIIIHIANITKSVLITEDVLMRIKARNLADIEADGVTQNESKNNSDDNYQGYLEVYLEDSIIDLLYSKKYLDIRYIQDVKLYPNMFLVINRFSGSSGSVLAKVDKDCKSIEAISEINNVYSINPKNVQQLMALHLLLDNEIPLVTLSGKAGTGKTLLALASALALNQDGGLYENGITCTTPTVDMGEELGFLPGNKDEKLAPYVQSYFDALEFIYGGKEQLANAMNSEQTDIQIDALNYIRGRSLPNQFFIVDEAQNLTKHEVKTIITRMGENSKIVLMGDPQQIDAKYLNEFNNGLSHVIDKFKDFGIAGHITLKKGERSPLADIAADIL